MDESVELGHNSVAVGIDKGKNSQSAVKWAIDTFAKGKGMTVVLIHVKTHNFNNQAEGTTTASAPTDSEVQQLFLPYRGFCSRKGIDAIEVVLHDIDVSSALISYIEENNIGNVVVGASNRNAITRRFKSADVPTSLEKSAPDFCAVYVIYKGKVQSMRASEVCIMPSAAAASSRASAASGSSMRSYKTTNSKLSFSGASVASGGSSQYSTPNNSNPRMPMGAEAPIPYQYGGRSPEPNYSNPRSSVGGESPNYYPYNGRSFEGNYSNPRSPVGGESPNPYSYNSRSTDGYSTASNNSAPRMQGQPPIHPYSNNSSDYIPRNYSQEGWRSENSGTYSSSSEGPYRGQNPMYVGSNQNSYQSASSTSIESYEQRSRQSTSSHSQSSFTDEMEAEMNRLKQELKKTMDLYHSICEQATVAKQQADSLENGDEEDVEELKLAREAAIVVADLERIKCQAAMDAAQMSEKLMDMENRKRKIWEQRAARREEEEKRANKSSYVSYRVYSLEDIEVATEYFSNNLKIGEGGYGPVYKAMLQHTPVAIKVLRPDVSEGLKQFQQEIEVLSRMRHPNMVLLVGACPEYGCLVYEYMENGSLEDRLFRKNNTPSIPWRTRFKIAAEIATALCFLHEAKPDPMVHRDLKPANILLDSNYTSKIGDVGLARLVPPTVANEMTKYHMTAAAGTFCYIDPEYQQTGQLGTKSDIYSLGIILLQILTARSPMALSYHVEEAIDGGTFEEMLDPTVPDWPYEEALSLAQLALKCCELRKKNRPDLNTVIMPELIRLKELAMSS